MANDGDICPLCKRGVLEIKPPGVSKKTGKPYRAFLVCPAKPCDFREWLSDAHPANQKAPEGVITASALAAPLGTTAAPQAEAYRPPTTYNAVSLAIESVCWIRSETLTAADRINLVEAFSLMLKAEMSPPTTAAPAWPVRPTPPPVEPGADDDIPF